MPRYVLATRLEVSAAAAAVVKTPTSGVCGAKRWPVLHIELSASTPPVQILILCALLDAVKVAKERLVEQYRVYEMK